ncbi:hypothetical protein A3L01_03310 [Thermococcus barossii]|uniref:Uncharacterized protein n=1 Tax=Thermococcus barossii TaxID=54077 RepID=A0A2Z2MEV3_9EURY|nr:hypothetical protein A3L01_03310 [Thermococcus barossii]
MRFSVRKLVIVLFLVLCSVLATPAAASDTYDVVLSDTGPTFYATKGVGVWPFIHTFKMQGEVISYSTSWYYGSGYSQISFPFLGLYSLDYAYVRLTNSAGFYRSWTYHQASFTCNFYYPYLSDADGGPSSRLTMKWHYEFVGDLGSY